MSTAATTHVKKQKWPGLYITPSSTSPTNSGDCQQENAFEALQIQFEWLTQAHEEYHQSVQTALIKLVQQDELIHKLKDMILTRKNGENVNMFKNNDNSNPTVSLCIVV